MKTFIFLIIIGCFINRTLLGFDYRNSVVQVFTTLNKYNYITPWNAPIQYLGFASGFIIEGDRILTNAHVVSESVFVQVKLDQESINLSFGCISCNSGAFLAVFLFFFLKRGFDPSLRKKMRKLSRKSS